MQPSMTTLSKLALLIATLCLQACASGYAPAGSGGVAEAFEASGTVAMKPYTRSVFSSNNF